MTYIVANWKANKTEEEARTWIEEIGNIIFTNEIPDNKKIIICPTFSTLAILKGYILANNLPMHLGVQDISRFKKGAYTGEIPAEILDKNIEYSIIGHSERRQNFGEDDETLQSKVKNAKEKSIKPIFCVQNEDNLIPQGVEIVAYEPIEAIGSGKPDSPDNAEKIARLIKERNPEVKVVLYGGSVSEKNVKSFSSKENIDGVLVGGASLDSSSFFSIIREC